MRLVIKQGARRVVVDTSKVKAVGTGPFNLAPRGVEVVIAIGADDVVVEYAEGGVDVLKTADAAAAEALVDRIAAAVGEVVEPLSEAPSNGMEDAEDDDAMGAVMAGRVRNPASEWVAGEPPKDGRMYVVTEGFGTLCVEWRDGKWRCGGMVAELGRGVFHLPTPIPNR